MSIDLKKAQWWIGNPDVVASKSLTEGDWSKKDVMQLCGVRHLMRLFVCLESRNLVGKINVSVVFEFLEHCVFTKFQKYAWFCIWENQAYETQKGNSCVSLASNTRFREQCVSIQQQQLIDALLSICCFAESPVVFDDSAKEVPGNHQVDIG